MVVANGSFRRWLLSACAAWMLFACGPGAATPMPEPPSIDGSRVGVGQEVSIAVSPAPLQLSGAPGAAPPEATVRVTNLDDQNPPVATTARDDGSFDISVQVAAGDELRFEARTADGISEPVDLIVDQTRSALSLVEEKSCLVPLSGYALDVRAGGAATVELENHCGEPLTLENLRLRTAQAGFLISSTAPVNVASAQSGTITVELAGTASAAAEDVLFFDVIIAGVSERFAISLRETP